MKVKNLSHGSGRSVNKQGRINMPSASVSAGMIRNFLPPSGAMQVDDVQKEASKPIPPDDNLDKLRDSLKRMTLDTKGKRNKYIMF